LARQAPGCLDFAVSADPVDPAQVNVFEWWAGTEALDGDAQVLGPMTRLDLLLFRHKPRIHGSRGASSGSCRRWLAERDAVQLARQRPLVELGDVDDLESVGEPGDGRGAEEVDDEAACLV
jgi:hypothetical protein